MPSCVSCNGISSLSPKIIISDMDTQTTVEVSTAEKNTPVLENLSWSKQKADSVSNSLAFRSMIFLQIMACGSFSVLVHLCERDGAIMFSSATMNLVLEFIKLVFSLAALYFSSANTLLVVSTSRSWLRHSLPYSIPGLLYFINNNLAVHIQLQMDPASYQILSNFKIATTAILYRLIIKQKLSRKKWLAVVLLFISGLFYSLGTVALKKSTNFC